MVISSLKAATWHIPKSILAVFGVIWLVIEAWNGLSDVTLGMDFTTLAVISILVGITWTIVDGYFIAGFLRNSISLSSRTYDTKIEVIFGDIFKQQGYLGIAVNDFFDSIVDDRHVSSRSLHGLMLQRYWPGNVGDWDQQIDADLSEVSRWVEQRTSGKGKRYPIGTTAFVRTEGKNFLCVALSRTNIENQEAKAELGDVYSAVRALLTRARSVCANEVLCIPLFGSGLSRVGISSTALLYLILTVVIEESKANKVTDVIRIVLPKVKSETINLQSLKKDWS